MCWKDFHWNLFWMNHLQKNKMECLLTFKIPGLLKVTVIIKIVKIINFQYFIEVTLNIDIYSEHLKIFVAGFFPIGQSCFFEILK